MAGFDPESMSDFASHVLIEYVYNENASVSGHYRSYNCRATEGSTPVGWLNCFSVMFGKSEFDLSKATRRYAIDNMTNTKEYRDRIKGGPQKVAILPVALKSGEKFMFIDMVVPIRAIYLPLAQKASSLFPELCTYLQIDFRFRKGVQMYFDGYPEGGAGMGSSTWEQDENGEWIIKDAGPQRDAHPRHWYKSFSYKEGLGLMTSKTLGVNIRGLYNYLIIPRQLRNPEKGIYCPLNDEDSLVRIFDYESLPAGSRYEDGKRAFEPFLDYTKVIQDHFGVDVVWQPYEFQPEPKSIVTKIFTLGVSTGLELIPVVGPLVSTAFSVFMEVMNDPESFKMNNILQLDGDCMAAVLESALDAAANLAPSSKGRSLSRAFK